MNNNANKFILKNDMVENPEFNFENKNNSIIDFPNDIPHTKLNIENYDILDVETPEALWTYKSSNFKLHANMGVNNHVSDPLIDGVNVMITWDTEYYSENDVDNIVLSSQFCVVYHDTVKNIKFIKSFMIWHKNGFRLSFSEMVSICLKKVGVKFCDINENFNVLVYSHFSIAEWSTLSDRKYLIFNENIEKVRKFIHNFLPIPVMVTDFNKRKKEVNVFFRDSILIAPQGFWSLDKFSSFGSIKKIDVEQKYKENMNILLKENRQLYIDYSMTDVFCLMEIIVMLNNMFLTEFGLEKMPVTIGNFTIKCFQKYLYDVYGDLLDINKIKGFEKKTFTKPDGKKYSKYIPGKVRNQTDSLTALSYYGGYNIAYAIGYFNNDDYVIFDYDFAGAYTNAMACLACIDFSKRPSTVHPNQFKNAFKPKYFVKDGIKYVYVDCVVLSADFDFGNEKYPCIPIKTEKGLVYVLHGNSHFTGPEMDLALEKMAKMSNVHVYKFSHLTKEQIKKNSKKTGLLGDTSPILIYAEYLRKLVQKRKLYPAKTIKNVFYKDGANSFYGKLAQGVSDRKISPFGGKIAGDFLHDAYGLNNNEISDKISSRQLEPSAITNPVHAAMITGIIRSALISMVSALAEMDCIPLSATTDGCMVAVPKKHVNMKAFNNPNECFDITKVSPKILEHLEKQTWCNLLKHSLHNNLNQPNANWLEIKHIGDKALTFKTRMYYMLNDNKITHVAKGGHQFFDEDKSVDAIMDELWENESIVNVPSTKLASPNDILYGVTNDVVRIDTLRKSNVDFDYKLQLLPLNGKEYHETSPHKDINSFLKIRTASENVRKSGKKAKLDVVLLSSHNVQIRGGAIETIKRNIYKMLSSCMNGWRVFDDNGKYKTLKEIAEILDISYDTFKGYKRRGLKQIPYTDDAYKILVEITQKLNMKITDRMLNDLFIDYKSE